MSTFWGVVIPLALDKTPDPADVKQGWVGFIVFVSLIVAVLLLWLSFRKQLKKVNFDEDATVRRPEHPTTGNGANGHAR